MNNDISRAVTLIRNSPHLEDDELYHTLVAGGMDRRRSARLIEFLPTAYTRLILRNSGVRVSDKFQRRLPNGEISVERSLSEEPIWNEALKFASDEINRGLSIQDLFAIAGRSPEFRAINQLLEQGSKLEDIACTALLFSWPELGPD
jgi:hypothetical protein